MSIFKAFQSCVLVIASCLGTSSQVADEPAPVEIVVNAVDRLNRNDVRFRVSVTNTSDKPIFFTAIDYELLGSRKEFGPSLYPIYLEQWRAKDGWVTVTCIDTPPPHVMKLEPGRSTSEELLARLPISFVCRNRITIWEGTFRFRLEYFDSKEQARDYVTATFSTRGKIPRAPVALSKSFEIPSKPK